MGRIRTIKPELPQSESLGRVSREARLCFILLWTVADDSGRLRGNSRMLASLLYPYDDDVFGLIEGWFTELEREDCIRRYVHDRDNYLEIRNWLIHQKIDHPSKSKFPAFGESSRILSNPRENSLRTKDQGPRTKEEIKATLRVSVEELPDWVPSEEWQAYVEMRKKKRAPLTSRAQREIVKDLDRLRAAGHSPSEVLLQSVKQAWTGVFEIKANGVYVKPAPRTIYATAGAQ